MSNARSRASIEHAKNPSNASKMTSKSSTKRSYTSTSTRGGGGDATAAAVALSPPSRCWRSPSWATMSPPKSEYSRISARACGGHSEFASGRDPYHHGPTRGRRKISFREAPPGSERAKTKKRTISRFIFRRLGRRRPRPDLGAEALGGEREVLAQQRRDQRVERVADRHDERRTAAAAALPPTEVVVVTLLDGHTGERAEQQVVHERRARADRRRLLDRRRAVERRTRGWRRAARRAHQQRDEDERGAAARARREHA